MGRPLRAECRLIAIEVARCGGRPRSQSGRGQLHRLGRILRLGSVAGHTHGGQCKPPFLAPPLLPVRNRHYSSGKIALSGGRRMYISRGVGHLMRVRFNARPEITVFKLVSVVESPFCRLSLRESSEESLRYFRGAKGDNLANFAFRNRNILTRGPWWKTRQLATITTWSGITGRFRCRPALPD